jgi:hypothetical protein
MKALCFSETSVYIFESRWRHNPEQHRNFIPAEKLVHCPHGPGCCVLSKYYTLPTGRTQEIELKFSVSYLNLLFKLNNVAYRYDKAFTDWGASVGELLKQSYLRNAGRPFNRAADALEIKRLFTPLNAVIIVNHVSVMSRVFRSCLLSVVWYS